MIIEEPPIVIDTLALETIVIHHQEEPFIEETKRDVSIQNDQESIYYSQATSPQSFQKETMRESKTEEHQKEGKSIFKKVIDFFLPSHHKQEKETHEEKAIERSWADNRQELDYAEVSKIAWPSLQKQEVIEETTTTIPWPSLQ